MSDATVNCRRCGQNPATYEVVWRWRIAGVTYKQGDEQRTLWCGACVAKNLPGGIPAEQVETEPFAQPAPAVRERVVEPTPREDKPTPPAPAAKPKAQPAELELF